MRELIEHSRAADRFGLWLCSVSLAIAGVAVGTEGFAILRPAAAPLPAVIEISFSAPPPAPLEPAVADPLPLPMPEPPPVVEPEVAVQEVAPTPPEPEVKIAEPEPAPPAEAVAKIEAKPPEPAPVAEPKVADAPPQPKLKAKPAPPTSRRTQQVESHVSTISPARPTRQYRPRYPSSARRAGVTGTTQVLASVAASGRVTSASIARSSGSSSLDAEALRAIRKWRFSAARNAKGSAVASRVQIPIRFQLN